MKKRVFSFLLLCIVTLSGCGSTDNTSTTSGTATVQNDSTSESSSVVESSLDETTETSIVESESPSVNRAEYSADFSEDWKGLVTKINKVVIAELTDDEVEKQGLENKYVVQVYFSIDNTSDTDFNIYPDQSTLVIEGQQIEAEMFLSDSIGGEILSGVSKEGIVTFSVPKIEDVSNVANIRLKWEADYDTDNYDEEKFANLKAQRDKEVARRDNLKEQLDAARAEQVYNMPDSAKEPLNDNEKDLKAKFVKDFIGMMNNDPKVLAMVTSSKDDSGNNAGLTIPEDIQTAIHQLVRRYDSLEQYVNRESVSMPSGSRVFEKWTDVTPLANLDNETAAIGDNDDPKLTLIKFAIKRYAGITTVTNTLLKDTAENILAWLSAWIAKKVVVTRNKAIIDVMNKAPKKPTIADFDGIIDLINTGVDPAIKTTSFLMTNTSGLNTLAKVKDAMGRYLLQPDPKQPDQYIIKGKRVIEIADRWLPDNSGSHPLYYGDLKQAVTLFDRENMSLLSTNIGGGAFEKDLTKVRVIDRFDVVATDSEAWVAGSFKTIKDQEANLAGTPKA